MSNFIGECFKFIKSVKIVKSVTIVKGVTIVQRIKNSKVQKVSILEIVLVVG